MSVRYKYVKDGYGGYYVPGGTSYYEYMLSEVIGERYYYMDIWSTYLDFKSISYDNSTYTYYAYGNEKNNVIALYSGVSNSTGINKANIYVNARGGDDIITAIAVGVRTVLVGSDGNDNLRGGYFNDNINGGEDDDIINGGGGRNIQLGGKGNDIIYSTGNGNISDGGPGPNDILTYANAEHGIVMTMLKNTGLMAAFSMSREIGTPTVAEGLWSGYSAPVTLVANRSNNLQEATRTVAGEEAAALVMTPSSLGANSWGAEGAKLVGLQDFKTGFGVQATMSMAWAEWLGMPSWTRGYDFGNGAARDNIQFGQYANTTRFVFEGYSGSQLSFRIVTREGLLVNGRTFSFATSYDAETKIANLYINGVLEGTATATSPISLAARTNNYIGKSNWGSDSATYGYWDDPMVFDRAIEQKEVTSYVENTNTFASDYDILRSIYTNGAVDVATNVELIIGSNYGDSFTADDSGATYMGMQDNDLYILSSANSLVVEILNQGIDTVQASISYTLPANVENLTLTGSANINGTGNELNNVIIGNAGKNVLNGLLGVDVLTGNNGADTFAFTVQPGAANADHITDFNKAEGDVIGLARTVYTNFPLLVVNGLNNIVHEVGKPYVAGVKQYIDYNTSTGELFYDASGNGTTAALLIATLDNKPAVSNLAFVVI